MNAAARRPGPIPSALVLALLASLLYGSVVRLWWTFDDLFHIHFLLRHSPLQYCFVPRVWRELPFQMFTPLQFLSYHADLLCFGLRPHLFDLHQLVVFTGATVAIFWVLRLWLEPSLAFLASLLFMTGAPQVEWVQELMLRHYIEGLVFATLSVGLFVKSVREKRRGLSVGSAVLYMVAMLAKEVYVPLLGLLLLLPEGEWRFRFRCARPHLLALAAYLSWRYIMLGTLLGGYGWTVRPEELPRLVFGLPAKLLGTFLGGSLFWNGALLAALFAGACAAFLRRPRALVLFCVALVLVALPLVPISKAFQPRYGGLAWLAVVVTFSFGCQRLSQGNRALRISAVILASSAVAASLAVNRDVWRVRMADAERMGTEEMFFLGMKGGELLRHPLVPPAALNELRWYKEEHLGYLKGSGWFEDDLYLCGPAAPVARVWQYQEASRAVEEITESVPAVRSRYCSALRQAPLEAHFRYERSDLFWDLGPYAAGSYAIVLQDGIERYDVARHDGYRNTSPVMTLRVRYQAPEGWVTFSPDLRLDFRSTDRIRWNRESPNAAKGIR